MTCLLSGSITALTKLVYHLMEKKPATKFYYLFGLIIKYHQVLTNKDGSMNHGSYYVHMHACSIVSHAYTHACPCDHEHALGDITGMHALIRPFHEIKVFQYWLLPVLTCMQLYRPVYLSGSQCC